VSKLGVNAILVHKEHGYDYNKEDIKDIPVGTVFEVDDISISQSHTSFTCVGHNKSFNSVQFEFIDDDGKPVDIFADARFNPYIQYKMA
jgi:hypothetical protein